MLGGLCCYPAGLIVGQVMIASVRQSSHRNARQQEKSCDSAPDEYQAAEQVWTLLHRYLLR